MLLAVCAGPIAACGKKGPPLPPVARVPAPPGNPRAVRVGNDVYVSFGVPSANVSGQMPADVGEIDLYAFTGFAPPPGPDPTKLAVRIGTYAVQPVLPSPPPPPEGVPVPPPLPLSPGFVQGTTAVVRETLMPEALSPTPVPGADAARDTQGAGEGALRNDDGSARRAGRRRAAEALLLCSSRAGPGDASARRRRRSPCH